MCINANYQKITEVAYSLQMLFKKVIVRTHWIIIRMKEFLWIEILWVPMIEKGIGNNKCYQFHNLFKIHNFSVTSNCHYDIAI